MMNQEIRAIIALLRSHIPGFSQVEAVNVQNHLSFTVRSLVQHSNFEKALVHVQLGARPDKNPFKRQQLKVADFS
jgi:hypothetical protein